MRRHESKPLARLRLLVDSYILFHQKPQTSWSHRWVMISPIEASTTILTSPTPASTTTTTFMCNAHRTPPSGS